MGYGLFSLWAKPPQMCNASQLDALAIRPDYTKEDCVAEAETVN